MVENIIWPMRTSRTALHAAAIGQVIIKALIKNGVPGGDPAPGNSISFHTAMSCRKIRIAGVSVLEMPFTGKEHDDAAFIGLLYGILVTDTSTGLCNGFYSV